VIDHLSIDVGDYGRSKDFYTRALEPLGCELLMEFEQAVGGFGRDRKPFFWIRQRSPSGPIHVAFAAPDRETVDRFYEAALAAGGEDNGAPGLRPHYHANYYGAFVLDPDGNNVEAVNHG
jgi:catechol 2,3-dioxygenase-like lactoylglutathione lyase family enzyme